MPVTTHHLVLDACPAAPPRPLPDVAVVMRADPPTPAFYRFLYRGVGNPWAWTDRASLDDGALAALVTHEAVHVHVLYLGGSPAGYAELRYGPLDVPETVPDGAAHLLYFGLMPHAIGRGLGRAFLDWTVREAFAEGWRRYGRPLAALRVHTCSLDHPRALGVYETAGFVMERTEVSGEDRGAVGPL